MRPRLVRPVAVGAALALGVLGLAAAAPPLADAVTTAPPLAITPSPAVVGNTVTISNADATGACTHGADDTEDVQVTVTNPDSVETDLDVITPDDDGNWSGTFSGTSVVGTYQVTAICGEKFWYADSSFDVDPAATTTTTAASTTTTAAASTTTTAAAAAAVAASPSFTG